MTDTTPSNALSGAGSAVERTVFVQPRWRFLTTWTPALVKSARLLADGGTLRMAADLCEEMIGDDRVAGVLGARARGLLGLPLSFVDGTGKSAARKKAKKALEAEQDFAKMAPASALVSLLMWALLLGVGLGEWVWETDPDTGREIPRLVVWNPRWLRFDYPSRKWMLRVGDDGITEIEIRPGEGKWLLFCPYGEERPWAWAPWRGIAPWWLLKIYGRSDFFQHSTVHGDPIRVGTTPEGALKPERDAYAADIQRMQGHSVMVPPPGYGLSLVEAKAATWQMFPAEVDMANTGMAILLAGQNLTTEVSGGSFAAATVHGSIRHDLIAFDATGLSGVLRAQGLVFWALFNFGDAKLALSPSWDTTPPGDAAERAKAQKDRAAALQMMVDLIAKARDGKLPVDLRALFDEFAWPYDEATIDAALASGTASAAPQVYAWHLTTGMLAPDEARKLTFDLGPLPDGAGAKPIVAGAAAPAPAPGAAAPRTARAGHPHAHERKRVDVPIDGPTASPKVDADTLIIYRLDREDDPKICPTQICDYHRDIVRPAGDPWWGSNTPPLHYRCVCYLEVAPEGAVPSSDDVLRQASPPLPGFGRGTVPLAEADEALAAELEAQADALGLPPDHLGRPPRDGGTGRVYNPLLPVLGTVLPGRALEIGAPLTLPWEEAWGEWDGATVVDRMQALLAAAWAAFVDTALDELTDLLDRLSKVARAIVDSARDRLQFPTDAPEDDA